MKKFSEGISDERYSHLSLRLLANEYKSVHQRLPLEQIQRNLFKTFFTDRNVSQELNECEVGVTKT